MSRQRRMAPAPRFVRLTAALLVAATLLLSGCWDVREMNHLALVMGAGVDKSETPGRYKVTVQIARPKASEGGGGGGGGGGEQGSVYTISADGDTIFAAIRNLAQFSSRRIMWAHNDIVVIGESLAREDITPVLDFFTRNQELRMRTWVAVARGTTASDLLSLKTGMEAIPADSLAALFRYAQLPGESVRTDIGEVARCFFSLDRNPVISVLQVRSKALAVGKSSQEHGTDQQVELRGTAIFNKNRLVGFVDSDAARGLQLLRRAMSNTIITVPSPGTEGKNIAVEVRSPKMRIQSDVTGDVPFFDIQVSADGWLEEQDAITPEIDTLDLKDQVAREAEKKMKNNVTTLLKILQQDYKVDAVDFGEVLHIQHPDWWHKNRDRWPELFPEVETRVRVRFRIPKMGLYTRPMNLNAPAP